MHSFLFGFDGFIVSEHNPGGTVEDIEVSPTVIRQDSRSKFRVRSEFLLPVVEQPLLDNDQSGVQQPVGQPIDDEVYRDLRLPQPLLMEDGSILKVLDSIDRRQLVCECLVLEREIRLPF